MANLHRNRWFNRLFFSTLIILILGYLIIYLQNISDSKSTIDMNTNTVSVRCINKICIERSGLIECIDLNETLLFKISFNENINISRSKPIYSLDLVSLNKSCVE